MEVPHPSYEGLDVHNDIIAACRPRVRDVRQVVHARGGDAGRGLLELATNKCACTWTSSADTRMGHPRPRAGAGGRRRHGTCAPSTYLIM